MSTPTPNPTKGATMYLPNGTKLAGGIVVAMTLTAYKVATPNGTIFVPFTKVHPTTTATPLVTFA